jgi:hypothetical protein
MKNLSSLLILLLTSWSILHAQTEEKFIPVSSDVRYQYIETYSLSKLEQVFNKDLEDFLAGSKMKFADFKGKFETPRYPVRLYRVYYESVVPEFDNQPTLASGLVAVPETGLDSMPILSYQHGTVFGKNQCPSQPNESMETKLMIAQYASQGYVVIGADYFGLGVSDLPNAYLIRQSSEQACLDMLFAAKDVLNALKIKQGPLFLHGWSQGGWTNMTFLRKLESLNIPVMAAGTASAPADAFGAMNRWFNNYQPIDAVYLPACLSNYIFAVEKYHQMDGLAASAIRPEYYEAAKKFFEWNMDWDAFRKQTGDTVRNFLRPGFMETGNIGNTAFWQVLENGQAYRWRCHTPLKMFYGDMDEVVAIYIATLPAAYHKLLGVNTTVAESAGPLADHRATYVTSVIRLKPWFDGFLKKK